MDLRKYGTVALTVIALVAVMVGVRSCVVYDAWEERVEAVQDSAHTALARADSVERHAIAMMDEAILLEQRAANLAAEADSIVEIIVEHTVTAEEIRVVRESTPLDLVSHPAILSRDLIIDSYVEENARWQDAYGTLKEANVNLQNANTVLVASADSLVLALHLATAAAAALDDVLDDRPGAEKWWMPEVGVGPSIGIATDGLPYAGIGLNLSWEIPIG